MSDLNEEVGTCGFFCCPARWPESGQAEDQRDCAHPKESHYSIDGEALGCFKCEAGDASSTQ